jgi:AcrR family transcriptional regulator
MAGPATHPKRASARGRGTRRRAAHLGPERRRPLVLDAALRLYVQHGYRGTSMNAIAGAAGVTKPVVYACYPSKEALFRALRAREEDRLVGGIAAALPAEVDFDDVEGVLRDAFTAFFTAAADAPAAWRVVFDARHGEPAVTRRIDRVRRMIVEQVTGLVQGVLDRMDSAESRRKAAVLSELLVSVAEAAVRMQLESKDEWAPDELGALIARLATRGVAAV